MKRNRNREAGQVIIITAAGLVMLLGFMGLAVDMGVMRYEKRSQQIAADAAAIAGANNIGYGGVIAGGQYASSLDGYTDTGGGQISSCPKTATVGTVCVQIDNGPADGPHSGDANYVEARVAVVQPTFFMKALGIQAETIVARAVATDVSGASTGPGCLYTLGAPSAKIEGVSITGSAVLNATTCGINDNGDFDPTGGKLIVNSGTFGVSGDCNGSGCGKGTVTCATTPDICPAYSAPAASNPLASMTAPSNPGPPSGCAAPCSKSTSGTMTLNPGEYNSIQFGKNSVTTLNPGVYYIDGANGLTFKGGASVAGNGVMFYFTNGATIDATGGGNNLDMNLKAPDPNNCPACPSQYDGILFFQDPNDTAAPQLGGDDNTVFGGVSYFPSVEVTFFGNATNTAGMVIAKALALSGNPTINLTGATGLTLGKDFATKAVLVE